MRAALLALAVLAQDPPKAGPVKELHPNGKTKLQYSLDAEGRRDGQYQEYWEDGRRKVAAWYAKGALDRLYEEFHPNGKPKLKKKYVKGRLDGDLLRFDDKGVLLHRVTHKKGEVWLYPDFRVPAPFYGRGAEEIRKKLEEIDPAAKRKPWPLAERYAEAPALAPPHKAGKLKPDYLDAGLRHLRAYRWLAEVPHEVVLHEPWNELGQHGAVVMALNKDLSHTPPQPPGLPKDFFDKGYESCNKSNISMYPGGTLMASIDGFMEDSDPSNIERVGHRLWLLNPSMTRTGFGEAGPEGTYKTCHVVDSGGGPAKPAKNAPPPPPFIAYPSRGWYPVEYLDPRAAWSFRPKDGTFAFETKQDVKIEVWELDAEFDLKSPLKLDHTSVSTTAGKTLVFRPVFAQKEVLDGRRFLVVLTGPKDRAAYGVEFMRRFPPRN